jgi:hypothetical protein
MSAVMLTTIDNPFNPFTQWNDWLRYDEDKKYYTCGYLARIAKVADDLTDEENDRLTEYAIDEIVQLNINGLYKKVYENEEDEGPGEGV